MAAYGKLMDWGMNVCLGGVLSGETASVVAAAKADDMFIMETTGSADKCIDGNTNKAASAILYKNGVGALFGQNAAESTENTGSAENTDTAE